MEHWALVLADSVLLMVALAGAVLTLVRIRRVGGFPAALAGTACGVLVVAAIFDLVWWTRVYPDAFDADDPDAASTLNDVGILGTFLMISIAVGLLVAAANVGRPAAAGPAAARAAQPESATGAQPATATYPAQPQAQHPVQHQGQHQARQNAQHQGQHQTPHQAQHEAQPAQPAPGWTPPQQTQASDWNIHSGVWSIPRGTFDGPPPDQHQR